MTPLTATLVRNGYQEEEPPTPGFIRLTGFGDVRWLESGCIQFAPGSSCSILSEVLSAPVRPGQLLTSLTFQRLPSSTQLSRTVRPSRQAVRSGSKSGRRFSALTPEKREGNDRIPGLVHNGVRFRCPAGGSSSRLHRRRGYRSSGRCPCRRVPAWLLDVTGFRSFLLASCK